MIVVFSKVYKLDILFLAFKSQHIIKLICDCHRVRVLGDICNDVVCEDFIEFNIFVYCLLYMLFNLRFLLTGLGIRDGQSLDFL